MTLSRPCQRDRAQVRASHWRCDRRGAAAGGNALSCHRPCTLVPVKTSVVAGALPSNAVPQLTDACCPSQDLLPKPFCLVMAQEQTAHRSPVLSPSVKEQQEDLDVEPHQVPGSIPVVDVRLHARSVRCHEAIVKTCREVSTGRYETHASAAAGAGGLV